MKKISLLAILLFSVATFAQSNKDLMRRSASDIKTIEKIKKANNYDSDIKAWVLWKLKGITVAINLSDAQLTEYGKLWKDQYQALRDAYQKYDKSKSANSKVELMKLIVNNEESFRKSLPQDQLLAYLRYGDKMIQDNEFADNFMSDAVLAEYKKELQ